MNFNLLNASDLFISMNVNFLIFHRKWIDFLLIISFCNGYVIIREKRKLSEMKNMEEKKDNNDNNLYLEEHWLQLNFHLVIFVESRLRDEM